MSKRRLLYVIDVSNVFCTSGMSKRCLLYVMNVSKTSFVRYECLKDVFCTLWMSKRWLLLSQRCFLYIYLSARMSEKWLWSVINVLCYECIKDVVQTKRYGHQQIQRRGVPKEVIIILFYNQFVKVPRITNRDSCNERKGESSTETRRR